MAAVAVGALLLGSVQVRRRRQCQSGVTEIRFRAPAQQDSGETSVASEVPPAAEVSEAQRRVLVALCRPFKEGDPYATPATNQEIAGELFLSVDAVKGHLRVLFTKFDVEDLPQNLKRAKLVERALMSGAVTPREL